MYISIWGAEYFCNLKWTKCLFYKKTPGKEFRRVEYIFIVTWRIQMKWVQFGDADATEGKKLTKRVPSFILLAILALTKNRWFTKANILNSLLYYFKGHQRFGKIFHLQTFLDTHGPHDKSLQVKRERERGRLFGPQEPQKNLRTIYFATRIIIFIYYPPIDGHLHVFDAFICPNCRQQTKPMHICGPPIFTSLYSIHRPSLAHAR